MHTHTNPLTHAERRELRERIHAAERQRRAEAASAADAQRHADERHAERSAELAERRRQRLGELTSQRHADERDELRAYSSALSAAANSATDAKRAKRSAEQRREVLAARQRDEWQRIHGDRPMTYSALFDLVRSVADELPANVTSDERGEVLAALLVSIGAKHGWTPSATSVERGFIRRRMLGLVLNERERQRRRFDSAAWAAMAEAEAASDDERSAAIAANVWAAFQAPPMLAELRAATLGADYLADALGVADDDERLALAAALSAEHRQAPALAAALGISEATARKRLQRGREALRERWPSATELVAELSAVQAPSDDERVTLSGAERAAAELVELTLCATYRMTAARQLCGAPVGAGRWVTGVACAPPNRAAHYKRPAPPMPASDDDRATSCAVELRRSDAYRAQHSEKVRAAMLADALAELRAELAERKRSAAPARRFTVPSAAALTSIGSVAEVTARRDARRRSARAAELRQLVAAELRRCARRELRKRWLCMLAARHLERWQRAAVK